MSRPQDGLAHVAASLARLVASERPEWVSARSWALAHELVASLRSDAAEALNNGPTAAARALDVGRGTLARWRSADGWLAEVGT